MLLKVPHYDKDLIRIGSVAAELVEASNLISG